MTNPVHSPRLESLDILRGFDLFLLVTLHPILLAVGQVWDHPFMHSVLYQFEHEHWVGFRLWDMIMPLFMFMTGITLPFSLDSKIGTPYRDVYKRLFRRFILLWLLGMVMQGNLLGLDWQQFRFFSNTLQAIAIGYLVAALLYLHTNVRTMVAVCVLLLAVYCVPFWLGSDFSEHGNFAIQLDKQILGPFMDGVYRDEAGRWHFSESYTYAWIWSSMTFAVTVMMGVFAGKLIKTGYKDKPYRVLRDLMIVGTGCVLLGLAFSFHIPIIKKIWTPTMTLYSGGICFILMAIFYYVIDIRKWKKTFSWMEIYGMNSIVAYFLGEFMNFRPIIHRFTYGIENIFPDYKSLILTGGNVLVVFLILHLLYKNRHFVKV